MSKEKDRSKRQNIEEKYILELYIKYQYLVLNQIYKMIGDRDCIDDLKHDTFIRLIEYVGVLKSLNEPQRVSYIATTAKNTVRQYLRKKSTEQKYGFFGREEDAVNEIAEVLAETNDHDLENYQYEHLRMAIQQLGEKEQYLLKLKYFCDFTDHKISETLDINTSYVRVYLYRIRLKLKKMLDKKGGQRSERQGKSNSSGIKK